MDSQVACPVDEPIDDYESRDGELPHQGNLRSLSKCRKQQKAVESAQKRTSGSQVPASRSKSNPKCPDLAGGITVKNLALISSRNFS